MKSSTPEPNRPDPSGPVPGRLLIQLACKFEAVPPILLEMRQFLQRHGCSPPEISDCELALAEGISNAIKYADESARNKSIDVEILCSAHEIQLVVTDRTLGFEWPAQASLPTPESENGRGVYLIQAVMNHSAYFQGPKGNRLILRKRRKT